MEEEMHPFQQWLNQLNEFDRDLLKLAYDFFVVFSRFEYALKKAGFIIGNDSGVQPNWDRFANKYKNKFTQMAQNTDVEKAIEFFRQGPPRKQVMQVIRGWKPTWKLTDEDLLEQQQVTLLWLTLMVRRVRNNLFHGGKEIFSDLPRDRQLLKFSLVLLRCWLDLDKNVKRHFLNGLPADALEADFCSSSQPPA